MRDVLQGLRRYGISRRDFSSCFGIVGSGYETPNCQNSVRIMSGRIRGAGKPVCHVEIT